MLASVLGFASVASIATEGRLLDARWPAESRAGAGATPERAS
jgi:hypothetical protein